MPKALLVSLLLLLSVCSVKAQLSIRILETSDSGAIAAGISPRNKEELIANPRITVEGSGCKILSFSFSLAPHRGEYIGPYHTDGESFSQVEMDVIRRCRPGDVIFIEDVQIKCPCCSLPLKVSQSFNRGFAIKIR